MGSGYSRAGSAIVCQSGAAVNGQCSARAAATAIYTGAATAGRDSRTRSGDAANYRGDFVRRQFPYGGGLLLIATVHGDFFPCWYLGPAFTSVLPGWGRPRAGIHFNQVSA